MALRRLLLIDDEDDIREVAQVSLEIVGRWHVLAARGGAEGIRRARAEAPDAIILDVMMPDMDGAATYRQLKAHSETRHIPVVLLTATNPAGTEQREELRGLAVISKPFDPLRLPAQVAHALGWAA